MSFQKSTRVLKQEVLKLCGELGDGTSPFDADAVTYLDKVYQAIITGNNIFDMSCSEPWVWAQAKYPIILNLKPAVSDSALLTNGNTGGTFTTQPTESYEGRYLCIDGESDIYRIIQHDANDTLFQLDQPFIGSTGTLGVTIYKYDYEAFNDTVIINSKNCKIDFAEGGSQLTASLTKGSYSPTDLCTEIQSQLMTAGAESYTVTFDDITRKFTIVQGGTTFSLLFASGTNAHISASSVLGFDVEDQLSALTYTSAYALSGIARISKPITIHRNAATFNGSARDTGKIYMIDDNTFLRDYPMGRSSNAAPDKFCVVEQNKDGLWVLRFNASVQEETRVEVNNIPVARKLKDNVNSFPLIPGAFSDLLVYGAAHFIQVDKTDSKASDSLGKAQAELKALIAFNRQGSQLAGNNFGRIIARPNGVKRPVSGSAY